MSRVASTIEKQDRMCDDMEKLREQVHSKLKELEVLCLKFVDKNEKAVFELRQELEMQSQHLNTIDEDLRHLLTLREKVNSDLE
jgi:hypothetical protein